MSDELIQVLMLLPISLLAFAFLWRLMAVLHTDEEIEQYKEKQKQDWEAFKKRKYKFFIGF